VNEKLFIPCPGKGGGVVGCGKESGTVLPEWQNAVYGLLALWGRGGMKLEEIIQPRLRSVPNLI